jgi:hypothetical protein
MHNFFWKLDVSPSSGTKGQMILFSWAPKKVLVSVLSNEAELTREDRISFIHDDGKISTLRNVVYNKHVSDSE